MHLFYQILKEAQMLGRNPCRDLPAPRNRKKCKCGGVAQEFHTCPFDHEMTGNLEYMCNCCTDCEGNCADEV